ncbi:RTJK-like protein, partial [Mya arenaria]
HKFILDKEQEGFRERRDTTHALLILVEDVTVGMNQGKMTAAVSLDMEKAFYTVWRKGLMVKMSRLGIRGNIWTWIGDFLQDREAYCCVENTDGKMMETSIVLPKGSVLSHLLFNIFLSNMLKEVTSSKVKFADDEDEVNTVIAFTDGSFLGNPGPCGSGTCIYFNNQERVD